MEKLCTTYWFPVYAYVRRRGYDVPEAQDLTQEFFARMLQKNWVAQADPGRGRFRSFLLSALNHFLANEWRRSQAAKRGAGAKHLSIDDTAETWYALEPACELTPEKIYDRRWAIRVLDLGLARLKERYLSQGKGATFEALKSFLSAEADARGRDRAAAQLGISLGAIATAVYRLRCQYRDCVREEIAQTVSTLAEVEDEMKSLCAALG
jgi:DNA-directed RNA polymerase specialized sigma24 family protein